MSRRIAFLYLIPVAFFFPAGHAQTWKTIQVNPEVRIDLDSISLNNGTGIVNTQMINPMGPFSTTKNIVNCKEGIIEEKTSFLQEDRYRENSYFRENQGEWWDAFQIEKGTRHSKFFDIVYENDADWKALHRRGDQRRENIFKLVCATSMR